MTIRTGTRRANPGFFKAALLSGLTLALTAGSLVGLASPAQASGTVNVDGGNAVAVTGESTLQLSGSGFQSVQGGFGGIYVLFGWVDDPSGGSWSPSQGGVTGEDYRYVFDDEENPAGYQMFVTFPGSSTAYAANGGEVAADGTWSGTLKVPGAVFTTVDRQQNPATVDCTQVTCGIITIGAHGVKNANNESFTPVTFAVPEVAAPVQETTTGEAEAGVADGANASAETETGTGSGSASSSDGADNAATGATGATTVQPIQVSVDAPSADSGIPLSTLLTTVAVGILVLALLILAAGGGGYLATKSILLGVSPEALAKVRAKHEAKAHNIQLRSQLDRARLEAKAQKTLAAYSVIPKDMALGETNELDEFDQLAAFHDYSPSQDTEPLSTRSTMNAFFATGANSLHGVGSQDGAHR